MHSPFTIEQSARIAFGHGRLTSLADDIAALIGARARVLLITDRGVAGAGLVDRALKVLAAGGIKPTLFAALDGEPQADQIDQAAALGRAHRAQIVVGLGGGSALDLAKLAAAIMPAHAPSETYALCARPLPANPPPVICIPTTAGTGAEVTRTAVFTDGCGRKVWAWDDALRPGLALLDPVLTTSLPPAITAMSGLDALVHAIEAATSRRSNPISQAYALRAVRMIVGHLPTVVERPDDAEARAAMLVAANLAGLAIDGAGTCFAHALGHALGTIAKVPHGRAVALALRVALGWNVEAAPEPYRPVAEALGIEPTGDAQVLAAKLANRYARLLEQVGLKVELSDVAAIDAVHLLDVLFAPENRPMRQANRRRVTRAAARHLIQDLLAVA